MESEIPYVRGGGCKGFLAVAGSVGRGYPPADIVLAGDSSGSICPNDGNTLQAQGGGGQMVFGVKLIAHTTDPVRVVAAAAKLCYSPAAIEELFGGLDSRSVVQFISMLRESGHMSPFEHASFTFAVEGLSRVATHQLVRHRMASYSQRSQRYVQMGSLGCVIPPEVKLNPKARDIFEESAKRAFAAYKRMVSLGVPKEDARFVLPHGWETSIIVTMNARELRHFFELRLCRRAQWEIRKVARAMLALSIGEAGELFESAGPPCVSGPCRERKTCGRPYGGTEEVLEDR